MPLILVKSKGKILQILSNDANISSQILHARYYLENQKIFKYPHLLRPNSYCSFIKACSRKECTLNVISFAFSL